MTTCPTCGKAVDPLRARAVGVREGKVVAYCSPACAAAAESRPVRVPGPAVRAPARDLDSGPVIEIVHEPASGVVTSAKDERRPEDTVPTGPVAAEAAPATGEPPKRASRGSSKRLSRERTDSTEAKAGWDWIDEEPAQSMRASPFVEEPRRGGLGKLLLVVLLLGGAAAAAYYYFVVVRGQGGTAERRATPGSAVAVTTPDARPAIDAGPAAVTREAAIAQATAILHKHLAAESDRLQRLAAGALARTGDADAIALLAAAIAVEKVPAARFVLAYQLARAGDERGTAALVAGLSSPERSDKLDAARHLARLRDKRAAPVLASYLQVRQHRLRAAEELARLGDPIAIKTLEQIRGDAKAGPDEKATATLALAREARPALLPEVHALLEDRPWRIPAAYVLAMARDEAARPVLVEQLAEVTLRARAAYALRQLDPALDPAPHLPGLVGELALDKDQNQIETAEAILLLAGDAGWAKHE